ncbi:hypothetical protein BAUCODRAFT_534401 [Baudoinia panamericana UAMH 10762]|uniref:Uncharacterized protein n=1 Tax=Baudoinia panamericana (strain UAMH 10762) TaxID=717646 RepID=M2MUQ3_BAUPA|nr:uncharacterized protein BAUCODRAFT_534401 [Baudoinia panamericana UAMH 10762]EMC95303.1 hypothetical protein BAUCODRAFT_534401 [Baudoinia panamericana UAMH 10762]
MSNLPTDGPASEWKPQGSGPHPTLAGNMFDPGVKADGKLGSTGTGVGGTDEQAIRQEGLEHIRSHVDSPTGGQTQPLSFGSQQTDVEPRSSGSVLGSGLSSGSGSVMPASNPGYDDTTGGISQGSGGVSGSAHVHTPVPNENTTETTGGSQTVVGTVMGYLGLGGNKGTTDPDVETRNAGADDLRELASHATSGGSTGTGTGSGTGTSRETDTAPTTGTGIAPSTGTAGPASDSTSNTTGSDPIQRSSAQAPKPADSDVTTGNEPTDSADPTTKDTALTDKEQKTEANNEAHGGEKDKRKEGNRYNEDAIPTAGGVKLGQKHWGESQIVPDNPKPQQSEGAVSSSAGQPTGMSS